MPLRPYLSIIYNTSNLDISGFIRSFVLDISITQRLTDAATSVSLKIRDDEMKFQNDPMFNGIGDSLDIEIFYENHTPDRRLSPGRFYLDRVELSSPPDVLNLQAINRPLNIGLRTKKTRTFSSLSLTGIVSAIATEHGLSISGIRENITLTSWEQKDKSDLEFLMDLARDFDHIFRFDDQGRIYFQSWESLDNANTVWVFDKDNILSRPPLRFTQSDSGTYQSFTSYYDENNIEKSSTLIDNFVVSTDRLKNSTRYENYPQAILGSRGLWRRANSYSRFVEFTIEGNGLIKLGNNFAIGGYGTFDGNYQVQELRNSLNSNGWVTEIKGRKLYEESPNV
ncbi:MAG: hypothetical protein F6K14_11870 [Symploca sp. SIO2C1]|nr:hypothetical protein [Symploca sp. SIO2C1]